MLERSQKLNDDIGALFKDGGQSTSPRALLTLAMCNVAMEHAVSQFLLVHVGHHVTAMALVRLHFEAVVRAIWLHHGASDEWVTQYCAPMAPKDLGEPIFGPPIDAMLKTIDATAPPFVGNMLDELKAGTWKPMNSYVHGGAHAIVQSLRGATTPQLIAMLQNANGLSLMTANVFVLACTDARLAGRIRQIQAENSECLPPQKLS